MPDYLLPILAVTLAMIVLTTLSGILANYSVKLAHTIKIPSSIIVILLLGFIGSLGELFLANSAILVNYTELVLGTAIGVTIGMTLLVGGVSTIYNKGIPTSSLSHHKLIIALNFAVLLFILLVSDMSLSSTDGVILLLVYLYYIGQVARSKDDFKIKTITKLISRKQILIAICISLFAIVNMFLTSGFIMQQIFDLIHISGISLFIIAIALISPFSIIPELFFELKLSREGTSRIALSDLITSSITNLTLIAGLTAIISPIAITDVRLANFNLFFLALIVLLFDIYAYTGKKITPKEGWLMIIVYFVYLALNFALIAY